MVNIALIGNAPQISIVLKVTSLEVNFVLIVTSPEVNIVLIVTLINTVISKSILFPLSIPPLPQALSRSGTLALCFVSKYPLEQRNCNSKEYTGFPKNDARLLKYFSRYFL